MKKKNYATIAKKSAEIQINELKKIKKVFNKLYYFNYLLSKRRKVFDNPLLDTIKAILTKDFSFSINQTGDPPEIMAIEFG